MYRYHYGLNLNAPPSRPFQVGLDRLNRLYQNSSIWFRNQRSNFPLTSFMSRW
jgi:hypothetical protein